MPIETINTNTDTDAEVDNASGRIQIDLPWNAGTRRGLVTFMRQMKLINQTYDRLMPGAVVEKFNEVYDHIDEVESVRLTVDFDRER